MSEAAARSRLYALLSRCVLEGPTDAVRDAIADLPALSEGWPDGDADARAALHHAVFGLQTFPYESVFVSEDGLLGGAAPEAVVAAYAESGLPARPRDVEPDHLAVELSNLAWLAAAEADALADALPDEAARVRAVAARFLHTHLLRWLPMLAVALRPWPWHATVAELAVELALTQTEPPRWALPPEPPPPLSPPRRCAGWWTVPARAGFLLTAHAIDRLSADLGIPRGFGSRTDRLENLLCGALDREGSGCSNSPDDLPIAQLLRELREGSGCSIQHMLRIGPYPNDRLNRTP